ncbi:MAG: FkbM family methyltransferase [Deltaproteobacteria bacterium]|nr:FkbM family methyltransferase [Deltaproteobacteria bacterium]
MRGISKGGIAFNVTVDHRSPYRDYEEAMWNAYEDDWEPETFAILNKFLGKDSTFIDIGANIGQTTLYGAFICKHVYAVEPHVYAFKALKRNVLLNDGIKKKITLCHGAIGTTDGVELFGKGRSSLFSDIIFTGVEEEPPYPVEIFTIERFVQKHNIKKIDFLKIDIEGGEYQVLPRLRGFLGEFKPTVYISLHPGFCRNKMAGPVSRVGALLLPKPFRAAAKLHDNYGLISTFRLYKNVYTAQGANVSPLCLLTSRCIRPTNHIDTEFVLTDDDW